MKKNSTIQRMAMHSDISEDERNICSILCSMSDAKSHICSHVNRMFSRNAHGYKVFLSINVVGLPLARVLEVLISWGVIGPRQG